MNYGEVREIVVLKNDVWNAYISVSKRKGVLLNFCMWCAFVSKLLHVQKYNKIVIIRLNNCCRFFR